MIILHFLKMLKLKFGEMFKVISLAEAELEHQHSIIDWNVCVPLKHILKVNPQCDGVWRLSLREVTAEPS